MSRTAKEPTDRKDGISYTITGVPIPLWGQLKLICFQDQLTLRQGLLMAIEQFVASHKDTLNEALGTISSQSDGGGESDVQPGE